MQMDPFELVTQALQRVNPLLEDLEPDVNRSASPAEHGQLGAALGALRHQVLPSLGAALADLDAEDGRRLQGIVARSVGQLAALLAATGDEPGGQAILVEAIAAVPDGVVRSELEVHARELQWHRRLVHAQWLLRHGQLDRAFDLLDEVAQRTPEALQRERAEVLRRTPVVRGRGHLTDGFAAARPRPRWSAGRRAVSGALPVVLLLAAGTAGVQLYRRAPGQRAHEALGRARAAEEAGRKDEALADYDRVLTEFTGKVDAARLAPAAEGWVRLRLEPFPEPFPPSSVDEVDRLALRLEGLPTGTRRGAPTTLLLQRLESWAKQLGKGELEQVEAGLRLLAIGQRVAPVSDRVRLATQTRALHRTAAVRLEPEWPMEAVSHDAAALPDDAALAHALAVLRALPRPSTLLHDEAELVEQVLAAAEPAPAGLADAVDDVRGALADARALFTTPGREAILSSEDPSVLQAEWRRRPGDLELAVTLARLLAARGEHPKATSVLEAAGGPGQLTRDGQLLLAQLHGTPGVGRPQEAERILRRRLARWLPPFQRARRDLQMRLAALEKQLAADAETGRLPLAVKEKLAAAPKDQRLALGREWVVARLREDKELARLRARHHALEEVVPAALALGTLRLDRAQRLPEADREALLREVEQLMLAIAPEAEGSADFHLRLGEVLHRLGKIEAAERELGRLLQKGDLALKLRVAHTYRALGHVGRMRELCTDLVEQKQQPFANHAAHLLSQVAVSLAEREQWLARLKDPTPAEQMSLAEARGSRLLSEGKLAEADQEFARMVEFWTQKANVSAAAANNAAQALRHRYRATGDDSYLAQATEQCDAALRLQPDSALVLGNSAELLQERLALEVLGRWLNTGALRLEGRTALELLPGMLEGPHAAAVREALLASPLMSRMLAASRQHAALAPSALEPLALQHRWLSLLRDGSGLTALERRLQQGPPPDDSSRVQALARWEAGLDDDELRRRLEVEIARLERMMTEPTSPPTRAAGLTLLAAELGHRAKLTAAPADLERAVGHCRAAARAWDGLGRASCEGAALAGLGVLKAIAADPELGKAVRPDLRRFGLTLAAYRAVTRDPTLLASLRRQDDLRRAAELAHGLPAWRLGYEHWVLAELAGDEPLRRMVERALKDEVGVTSARVSVSLALPGHREVLRQVEQKVVARSE